MSKVILTNCLMRPQVFTLLGKETFRLTARGIEGFKKEIEKEKISPEVEKAIECGSLLKTELTSTDSGETDLISPKKFKKLQSKEE